MDALSFLMDFVFKTFLGSGWGTTLYVLLRVPPAGGHLPAVAPLGLQCGFNQEIKQRDQQTPENGYLAPKMNFFKRSVQGTLNWLRSLKCLPVLLHAKSLFWEEISQGALKSDSAKLIA